MSIANGLSQSEIPYRLSLFGHNTFPESKEPVWREIIEPFTEPMILLLLATLLLFFLVGELEDTLALFTIIAIVVSVEALQERKAKNAVAALRVLSQPTAKVIRDGHVQTVESSAVVPGDVLFLERGSKLAADTRLTQTIALRTDESTLTGESTPVEKRADTILPAETPLAERKNMAYAGTTVVNGHGQGIVVATGTATELGNIRQTVQEISPEKTPLQKRVDGLAYKIAGAVITICVIVVVVGILQGRGFTESLLIGLSLAVVTIPEDLPIIVVVILSFNLLELSRRRAIVKDPYRGEVLGSVTIICTDKTGTLTENKMQVTTLASITDEWSANDDGDSHMKASQLIARIASRASYLVGEDTAHVVSSDPTEEALAAFASSQGVSSPTNQPLFEIPFTETTRLRALAFIESDTLRVYATGAPESLISKCSAVVSNGHTSPLRATEVEVLQRRASDLAARGLRVISLAYRDLDSVPSNIETHGLEELVFVGFLGLEDPPREGVSKAVSLCQSGGIRVVMVTGDHPLTASAIARQVGMLYPDRVVTGVELDTLSTEELDRVVVRVNVFARILPEHKLRILRALQTRGDVVAMTGDGVNDGPALRQADVGVAMGETGTDVAKEAATMVLADDNFSTLVEGVKTGRKAFDNLRKAISYYLPSKLGILATVAVPSLVGLPVSLLPIQIILLEVLNDVTASTGYVTEPARPDIMTKGRSVKRLSLLSTAMVPSISINTAAVFLPLLALYGFLTSSAQSLAIARTTMFVSLVVLLGVMAIGVRSDNYRSWRNLPRDNGYLLKVVLATIAVALAIVYVPPLSSIFKTSPLSLTAWLYITLTTLVSLNVQRLGITAYQRIHTQGCRPRSRNMIHSIIQRDESNRTNCRSGSDSQL